MKKDNQIKNFINYIQDRLLFILVFIMFLPDFIRYPLYIVVTLWNLTRFVVHRWLPNIWIFSFIVFFGLLCIINHNYLGLGIAGVYFTLLINIQAVHHSLTEQNYDTLHYAVVWGSLFNFPFIFFDATPKWFLAIVANILSLFNLEGFPTWKLPPYGIGYYRAYSTFDNPNFYAFVLLVVMCVVFYQLQVNFKKRHYIMIAFYGFAMIINAYAMLLTETRSVLVASVAALITLVLVQQKWQMLKFLIMIGCLLLSYIILNPDIIPRLLDISSHMGIRTEIWANAIAEISKNPYLGEGFMTYALLFDTTHAHNIYIESMLSFGVIGSVMIVIYSIRYLFGVLTSESSRYFPFVLSLLIALMAFGVLDFPFYYLQTSCLFFLMLLIPKANKI